ncbi:DHHW family protein [Viridibacillus arvi]|uniref:DHHW family protein n=1 Tax=Viridibacillus arvi TaxID=263475 RepID=UPI003D2AA2B7
MKAKTERILVLGFVGTLFLLLLIFFILPKQKFSELENRYLQGIPQLTWNNIWSKKYAEDVEIFITDHFPFRDKWISVKSTVEQSRLQQENNDIYKGKDGYLFEKFSEPNYMQIQKYTESINEFADKHSKVNMTFLLAPTSIGLYPERLPWLAPSYPQKKVHQFIFDQMQKNLTLIDGFDVFSAHTSEPIYYRTDHHWTTYGAYLAYKAYADRQGWHALQQKDFEITTVSNSFLGSFHTKGQFSGVAPDTIQAYTPCKPSPTEMYISDTDKTVTSMYDTSFLDKKDQYSYFLGGVHALIKLSTRLELSKVEQEKLLVIKDSYAHSVIPFLTSHVPEIYVIDIRYYNGNISEYMSKNEIEDVLFLFNTTTFIENNGLLKLNN